MSQISSIVSANKVVIHKYSKIDNGILKLDFIKLDSQPMAKRHTSMP